jgi:hypothetical protein
MRCKFLLLLLQLLLTSCVNYARHTTYFAELEPPDKYNHLYNGPVVEYVISLAEVRDICGYDGVACSWLADGTCYRVLPSGGPGLASVSVYRRHETAHCNGWPANHPRD